ncbi:DUF4345 family protein [Congregibacter litoralis]|uniref:DUF4345 domain-containing protein n=1 Tax=Congregibacter litoralis KT71 TaxID=314285 RepID=A4ACG0_9GAMM|nr:DUF4345 family protein [Congregibacter litoralis]EAQ96388.1 Domain protein of unknown function [Congregibacter litoralis KT71]
MTRAFLILIAFIFAAYGVACILDPSLPARLAGLQITNGDGYAEMSAMYGGLQTGVGVFCLLGAFRSSMERSVLLLLVLGIGLLAATRALGALRTEEVLTVYTWGALAFETFVTAAAAALLSRAR